MFVIVILFDRLNMFIIEPLSLYGVLFSSNTVNVQSNAQRVSLCLWIISAVLLSYSYRGNLLSFLVAKEYESPIDSIDDILDRKLPAMNVRGTYMPSGFLNSAQIPKLKQLAELSKDTWINFNTRELCMGQLRAAKKEIVVIARAEQSAMEFYNLRRSKQLFSSVLTGMMAQKNAEWMPQFNQFIYGLVEGGIIVHWKERVIKTHSPKLGLPETSKDSNRFVQKRILNCTDLITCFVIWGIGIFISILTFYAEIWSWLNGSYHYAESEQELYNFVERQSYWYVQMKENGSQVSGTAPAMFDKETQC